MRIGLGTFLKDLRISRNERTFDMADKLNVSAAFLSSIEHGKKKPPANFYEKILDVYKLAPKDTKKLLLELDKANSGVFIKGKTPKIRQTAAVFARKADKLTDEQLNQISIILNGGLNDE